MALAPKTESPSSPAYRLAPLDPALAPLVASWCGEGIEALWLAPRTPPPITAEKVLGWQEEGRIPYAMLAKDDAPVAYGELNELRHRRREYWLGHLLVDPQRRGQGLGTTLTRLLTEKAFRE
ncbi:MAG: GNAT family N-acetyltransferase, partial [Firmicutes bacterium]|nr:GNAT family N-acetyltransferase [Bacillota bacterium]